MKRIEFTSEAELVKRAGEWLTADGWTTYFEVQLNKGGPRADIVATSGDLITVVECKLSLSLAVLEQCRTWTRYAHQVWAAVPRKRANPFAIDVAASIGAGVMRIGSHYWDRNTEHQPEFRRKIDPKLRDSLNETQRRTEPGASADYSTPFKETCTRLVLAVHAAGGRLPVKEAMTGLRHHNCSNAGARSSLINCAERGIIAGLGIRRDGRAVWFQIEEKTCPATNA